MHWLLSNLFTFMENLFILLIFFGAYPKKMDEGKGDISRDVKKKYQRLKSKRELDVQGEQNIKTEV